MLEEGKVHLIFGSLSLAAKVEAVVLSRGVVKGAQLPFLKL